MEAVVPAVAADCPRIHLTRWCRDIKAAIFQTIFSNAFSWLKIYQSRLRFFSLKFVSKGPINIIPALVQILAWRRPGDKQLSEPMGASLLTHIGLCVTRPQRDNGHLIIVVGSISERRCEHCLIFKVIGYAIHCWITFAIQYLRFGYFVGKYNVSFSLVAI